MFTVILLYIFLSIVFISALSLYFKLFKGGYVLCKFLLIRMIKYIVISTE
jgi:hypothetical protein